MVEQLQRSESARGLWGWLPVLLLLLLQVRLDLTEAAAPLVRLSLLLPAVAAWLGVRYGRRALGPILAVLPLMLLTIQWRIDNITIGIGAGAGVALLSVILAALFAESGTDRAAPRRDSFVAVAGLFALSLLAFVSAGVSVSNSSGYIDGNLSSPLGEEILALAAFAFVATRRVSAAMAATTAVIVVEALAFVGAAGLESLPTAELTLENDAGSFYIGAGLWAPSPAQALAFAVFGIVAGSLVAHARSTPSGSPRVAGRGAAVAILVLTPLAGLALGSSWTYYLPDWAFVDGEAGRVLLAQATEPESFVVCASPIPPWTFGLAPVLVGAAAAAWGLAWPNAARLWAPVAAVATMALLKWAGGYSFFYGCEEGLVDGVMDVVGYAALAWTGVWVADMFRAGRGPSSRVADISEIAWTVRRADASATLRAFAVIVVTLTAWVAALDAPIKAAAAAAYYGDSLSTEWILIAAAAGLLGLLAPLGFVVIDILSRRRLRRASGALAFGYGIVGHAVLAAVVLTGAIFVVESALWGRDDFDFSTESPQSWTAYALVLASQAIALLFGLWLMLSASRLETALAGPAPRAQLLGRIEARGLGPRIAHIVGLPSSFWRASALLRASFWLFVLARPVVYLGALVALGAASLGAQLVDFDGLTAPFESESSSYYDEEEPAAPASERFAAAVAGLGVESPLTGALAAAGAALVLIVLGHVMFAAAKRLASRRIWAPEKAGGAPVLFLRSFTDDQLAFGRPALDLVGRWLDLWSFRRNADEALIDELAQLGDVIALGRPGEKRTPFGAARRYTSHDDWKAAIADAAVRARLIVVAAGDTPGLVWEYERIVRQGLLAKTIVLFPPAPPGDPGTERAAAILFKAIPAARVDLQALGGALVALTVVDGQARAEVVSGTPRAEAYVAALRAFVLALGSRKA